MGVELYEVDGNTRTRSGRRHAGTSGLRQNGAAEEASFLFTFDHGGKQRSERRGGEQWFDRLSSEVANNGATEH